MAIRSSLETLYSTHVLLQALEASRDFDLLYTNRALACMKLERYQDALNDCDWALRV